MLENFSRIRQGKELLTNLNLKKKLEKTSNDSHFFQYSYPDNGSQENKTNLDSELGGYPPRR